VENPASLSPPSPEAPASSETRSRKRSRDEVDEEDVDLKNARFSYPHQGVGYCLLCNDWHGNPRQLCKKSFCGNKGMWFYDHGKGLGSELIHGAEA